LPSVLDSPKPNWADPNHRKALTSYSEECIKGASIPHFSLFLSSFAYQRFAKSWHLWCRQ